ncbi:MAG: hypothetical protein ACHRXM_32490 [Isosphaerales bacterium]
MSAQIGEKGRGRLGTLACWAALAANMAGCAASNDAAAPGFLPGWDEARQALVSALSAWRDAPSPLPDSFNTRSVQFVDKRRRPNQRLRAFQILGQADIENARQFTVRLNLEGEESPQLVKYNILGRDPVWVFRLEDYEMFSHWEHDMDEPAPGPKQNSKDREQLKKAN